jgi:hypothetical protein
MQSLPRCHRGRADGLRVTLKVFVPSTSAASVAKWRCSSEEVMLPVVTLVVKFQKDINPLLLTLKRSPPSARWCAGLAAATPGEALSPAPATAIGGGGKRRRSHRHGCEVTFDKVPLEN